MNDFVNPQHRGVNLPAGYKDLMDVLEAKKKESSSSEPDSRFKIDRIPSNGLAHVEKYLRRFFVSRSELPGPYLSFLTSRSCFPFMLMHSTKGPHAVFSFASTNSAAEKSVREILANSGIDPKSDSVVPGETVRVIQWLLPNELSDALRIVTALLKEAYGVSDADGLGFIYRV